MAKVQELHCTGQVCKGYAKEPQKWLLVGWLPQDPVKKRALRAQDDFVGTKQAMIIAGQGDIMKAGLCLYCL